MVRPHVADLPPSLFALPSSRLDLRDNRKVITDYRNLGIIHILTDLVLSSGYLSGVLRETSSSVVPRKASSYELGRPWGAAHVVCRGYPVSYPPQLVLERLVPVVQRRLELFRAGTNKVEQSNSWSDHRDELSSSCEELPSSVNRRRVV